MQLNAKPVFVALNAMQQSDNQQQRERLAFEAAAKCCRDLSVTYAKTHSFYVIRWSDDSRIGFSVLTRRRTTSTH